MDKLNILKVGTSEFEIADAEARENYTELSGEVEDLKTSFEDITAEISTYVDITASLEKIGDGYYNNPATMGISQWNSYDGTVTYKTSGVAGDSFKIQGYDYYGCKLCFLYVPSTRTTLYVYPESSGNSYHETTITLTQDCDLYFGTRTARLGDFKIEKSLAGYYLDGTKILPHSLGIDAIDDTVNPLYGKTALFFGDSICEGTSVGQSSLHYGHGYAGRIGIKNGMDWHNLGVSGRTVLYNQTGESNDVVVAHNTYSTSDYVIMEACLNDGFQHVTLGEISSGYTQTFDNTASYCEAFEYMLQQAYKLYTSARLGVVIPHRVSNDAMIPYHEKAREICKKWSVPFIDLYYESNLCVNILENASMYFSDGATHLTDAGYEMITPKIEAWMKTL